MDGAALLAAWNTLKSGTLWHNPLQDAKHPCNGYADANPGEAAALDSYVKAIAAGGSTNPPAASTATGKGLAGVIAALAPAAAPPPPPPPAAMPKQGISMPLGDITGKSSSDQDWMLDRVKELGNGHPMFLRIDWWLGDAAFAAIAAKAAARGITVMPLLSYPNGSKPTQQAFADQARQLAGLGFKYVNVLNEPDMSGYAPATAAAYFNAAGAAIKAVKPDTIVVGPSTWKTGSQKPGDGFAWCKGFVEAGGKPDVFDIHLYDDAANLDRNWNNWAWLPDYRALLDSHGMSAVPIMATEGGHGSNDAAYQDRSVSTAMDARDKGTIVSYLVYSLLNDAEPGGFGLYDSSRVARPAFATFKSKAR